MPFVLKNIDGAGNCAILNTTGIGSMSMISTPPAASLVTDGLFMKLDASNYSGADPWQDETAFDNDALITGSLWSATDGGIFDFDGTNDTMTIAHKSRFSLLTGAQRTMQMWVKFDVLPISPNRMIFFGKLSSAFSFDGWWGGITSTGATVIATNGAAISKTTTSNLTVNADTWYLYTFISQITSTANTTKVYVNETEYISTSHGSDSYSESNNVTLGYLTPPLAGLGQIAYLNGKIGAVYYYDRGLSAAEISTNYNATKTKYGL